MPPPTTPSSASAMNDRSPSPDIPQPVVYGRLHHFRGKSSAAKEGKSKQVFNIDALQVVFGREESCDIRIYADNVSRKHCKIVIDLLTGKATLHVLSSHGLKLNRVSLPGGSVYTLQDDDVINVMERKFRFEYASGTYEDDESSLASLSSMSPSKHKSSFRPSVVQPIIPPSPMAYHVASPKARRSSLKPPSTPFRSAPSTRMHLFPKDYASQEVRAALQDIGVEMEPAKQPEVPVSAKKSRKEDFVYFEDREELDAEESTYAQNFATEGVTEDKPTSIQGPPVASRKVTLSNTVLTSTGFSTPQPAKKITRVPRTSLAPRTRKSQKPVAQTTFQGGEAKLPSPLPQTPSSVPLPLSNDTPYVSSPFTPAGLLTPSIYPSLDQLSAFTAPQTPSPRLDAYLAYQTPRNVPLPSGGETPYGSSERTYEIDPALLESELADQQEPMQDVEMEDVSTYESTGDLGAQELSRSPGPEVLALSATTMTPRNVPLPSGGTTPYSGVPATPMSAFTQRHKEPASPEEQANDSSSLAMPETPRAIRPLDGPVSLRRRLLLRSAHKVMQEQISRRDMRRTMGVGSGLIGTPMRPRKPVERPVMESMSPFMSPISETPSAKNSEAPQTPSSTPSAAEHQVVTPSRIALPSPGQTEYENSFNEMNADGEDVEEYTEPLQDEYDNNGGHTSLAMYQTDFEEGEGDDDDAEGESDHEDEEGARIESSTSPVTPFEDFEEVSPQDSTYFVTADATDAVQFPSASTNQTLFQTRMVDVVSDDDDLVDRSLDVSPEMDEGSDEELEEEREVEASQMQASNDDLMGHDTSREEGGDKENEPLASDEEDEGALIAGTDSAPATFSSPSRAVRRPVAEEYYTPQANNRKTDRRGIFGRKSLSSIGGPAVRGTPRSELAPLKHAFGRLSLSEREIVKQERESEVKQEEDPQERAETSYSPMQDLPRSPPQGFGASLAAHMSTPSASSRHPAMDVPITVSSDSETETTPLQGLKNKLKNLRRKSTHANADVKEEKPFNRRATLGIPRPSTPTAEHSRFVQRPVQSAAPINRFMPKLEHVSHPTFTEHELAGDLAAEAADEGQSDEELPAQGDRSLSSDSAADMQQNQDDSDAEETSADHPMTEIQEEDMYHEREEEHDDGNEDDEPSIEEVSESPARTPVHKIRQHNEGAPVLATPVFHGIREMLKTPKAAPTTPRFSGMRQMFALQPEVSTPEMSGIVDLFPEVETTRREEEQSTSDPKARKTIASKLPARSRLPATTQQDVPLVQKGVRATTAASRSRVNGGLEESGPSRAATSTTSTGIRRTRTQPMAETASSDIKPRVTRTRVTQTLTASTSTDDQSHTSKAPTARATRARTATAEPEELSLSGGTSKAAPRSAAARTTRAKATVSKAPTEFVAEEDGEADPLEDITVPEPDPEDIKPVRRATRTPAATRTTTARPLATRSAVPQPSERAGSQEPAKPKTRTRTAAAGVSRTAAVKSSTEAEAVSEPTAQAAVKKSTKTTAGSRLTAPTASSKARSAPPPVAVPVPIRKTRAATSSVPPSEEVEASAIPKRATRARK